jgi:beta-lactamase class A
MKLAASKVVAAGSGAVLALMLATNAVDAQALRDAILGRVAATPGATVAVTFNDLQTGERVDINADTVFHAASTMKIPVMIELLRRSQRGAFSLDQDVLLVNSFASLADGSPFSLNKADDDDTTLYAHVGERVKIRELLRRMITRSSNLATNELIALVGAANVTSMARSLGAVNTHVLRGVEDQKAFDAGLINTTTSADLATLLLAIETGKVLSPAMSSEMRDILLAQEENSKIPAGLPPGTHVAHKTGEITAVSHDAAIIYPDGRKPYILVVLTRGIKDPKESATLIADISRLAWSHVMAAH